MLNLGLFRPVEIEKHTTLEDGITGQPKIIQNR
jgi:hypothetical protein